RDPAAGDLAPERARARTAQALAPAAGPAALHHAADASGGVLLHAAVPVEDHQLVHRSGVFHRRRDPRRDLLDVGSAVFRRDHGAALALSPVPRARRLRRDADRATDAAAADD